MLACFYAPCADLCACVSYHLSARILNGLTSHSLILRHAFTNQTPLACNFAEFFLHGDAENVLGLFVSRLKSAEIIARNISGGCWQWPSVQ